MACQSGAPNRCASRTTRSRDRPQAEPCEPSQETGSLALLKPLDSVNRADLLDRARTVARRSHSPYSHFRVGAAVLTTRGIFIGTNVENASYGLCLCAERAALAAAITAGATDIQAIAVACIDARKDAGANELMPCGACRQWFVELAPRAEIYVDGVDRIFTADDLLASPFSLQPRTDAAL